MTTDKLVDAIGMIDDDTIMDAKSYSARRYSFPLQKVIAVVAAVLVCLTLSIPVLAAATEIEPVYRMLYLLSPAMAQKLKPVRMSCVDNGIKMEVVSAYVLDNEANIVVSMEDLEGERIDGTMDLYDSYHINRPFDSTGTCSRLGYDPETGKATFLITISQWGDNDIGGDKITFSVKEFLSNKKEFEEEIPIDLETVAAVPQTQEREWYYHSPVEDGETEIRQEPCLVPQEECEDFVEGIDMTGYGYIDGKFHIQIAIANRSENDNHGSFYLVDEHGEKRYCDYTVDWKDTTGEIRMDYTEYVFDVPMEELHGYQLYGRFVTSEGSTKGRWQVTFPLENRG